MATFEQRESGWWQAKIRRKGFPDQSKTFQKKDDAEKWARDIESKIDRDVFVDRTEAESTTLKTALENYEIEVSSKKDGYDVEKVRIAAWKRDPLAKRSMASLKPADFAKWLAIRLNSVAPSTARKDLALISHLFTVAIKRWGMAVSNPISKIEIPAEDNARDRRLEVGEESYLLNALQGACSDPSRENIWILPLVQIAIETAARQGELLALKWADVDLEKRVIRIRGKDRADGKSRTKNKDKYRDVPLSTYAKNILDKLPRSIKGNVFQTSSSAVKQSFSRAVVRASKAYIKECEKHNTKPTARFLSDLTFHDLRHEATSRLAEKLAMHELMKVTGHKDTRMLARYYHPRAEDLAKKLA